ncbi:GDP-L-fucose synthase [uncultured archaeon]|nr:GDP-L-fucose synthase [uncultured archaeon]
MKILVTGGNGFIGSHLCRSLLEEEHEVFALSRNPENERIASSSERRNFHVLACDIQDLSKLQEIMETNKIDAVIHLAAYVSEKRMESARNLMCFNTNVKGTLNVLHACFLSEVSKIIYASSMGVYGKPEHLPVKENHPRNPLDFYSLTKLQGENYCNFYAQNYNIHMVVLRYAGVYGTGKNKGAVYNFTRQVLNGENPRISSTGNQTRDFVYVKDIVSATLRALNIIDEIKYDIFNIGSGRETSVNELLDKIINITGENIDFKYAPEKCADRFVLDITKAYKVLDYRPRPFDGSLAEFIQLVKSGG